MDVLGTTSNVICQADTAYVIIYHDMTLFVTIPENLPQPVATIKYVCFEISSKELFPCFDVNNHLPKFIGVKIIKINFMGSKFIGVNH